jgi:hypothetical protein
VTDDLDRTVDELYALPLEEFVAERDARARGIRAEGDRELAGRVAALPKPTVAAWLLNQLARQRPDAVDQLVRLGADLRAVQQNLDGDQLRALGRRRQQLVRAFVREAAQLAAELGRPLSGATATQVEDSLRAAVADESAGAALLAGRLAAPLSYVGMGEAAPSTPAPAKTAEPDEVGAVRERHRSAARQALVEVEREHRDATTGVTKAEQELRDLEQQHTHLQDRAAALRDELERVEAEIDELAERYEAAEEDRAAAAATAEEVAVRLERANRDLD